MALVLIGCFGVILWVINISSASLDAKQKEGEQRLLLSVTDDRVKDLGKAVADYTLWNELYEYFEGYQNPDWARRNMAHTSPRRLELTRSSRSPYQGRSLIGIHASSGRIRLLRRPARPYLSWHNWGLPGVMGSPASSN